MSATPALRFLAFPEQSLDEQAKKHTKNQYLSYLVE